MRQRLTDSVETALGLVDGLVLIDLNSAFDITKIKELPRVDIIYSHSNDNSDFVNLAMGGPRPRPARGGWSAGPARRGGWSAA